MRPVSSSKLMPSSSQPTRPLASSRASKAGSTQARATALASRAGVRESSASIWRRASSAPDQLLLDQHLAHRRFHGLVVVGPAGPADFGMGVTMPLAVIVAFVLRVRRFRSLSSQVARE